MISRQLDCLLTNSALHCSVCIPLSLCFHSVIIFPRSFIVSFPFHPVSVLLPFHSVLLLVRSSLYRAIGHCCFKILPGLFQTVYDLKVEHLPDFTCIKYLPSSITTYILTGKTMHVTCMLYVCIMCDVL